MQSINGFATLTNVVNLLFASKVRPEVVRDISKTVLRKSRLHKLHAFKKKILGTEICIKFESEEISITGDYCSKSDSKEEDRGKGTVVCVACRRSNSESDRYRGFVTVLISIIIIVLLLVLFGRVGVFILVFILCVIAFHKAYIAMLWRLCIFSKFCKGVY